MRDKIIYVLVLSCICRTDHVKRSLIPWKISFLKSKDFGVAAVCDYRKLYDFVDARP